MKKIKNKWTNGACFRLIFLPYLLENPHANHFKIRLDAPKCKLQKRALQYRVGSEGVRKLLDKGIVNMLESHYESRRLLQRPFPPILLLLGLRHQMQVPIVLFELDSRSAAENVFLSCEWVKVSAGWRGRVEDDASVPKCDEEPQLAAKWHPLVDLLQVPDQAWWSYDFGDGAL